nr:basic proline-rich protein-like [Chrysemys picta bellii]
MRLHRAPGIPDYREPERACCSSHNTSEGNEQLVPSQGSSRLATHQRRGQRGKSRWHEGEGGETQPANSPFPNAQAPTPPGAAPALPLPFLARSSCFFPLEGASPSAGGAPWWALEPLLFFFFLLPRSQLKAQRRLEEPDLGFFFLGGPCAEGTSPFSCPPAGSQVSSAAAGASCERLPDISGQGRVGRRKPRFTGRARLGYAPPGGATAGRELPIRGGVKRLPSQSPVPHAGASSPVRPSPPGSRLSPAPRAPGPPHLPRDTPRVPPSPCAPAQAPRPPGAVLLRVRSAPGCTRRQGSSRGKFLPDGRAGVCGAGGACRARWGVERLCPRPLTPPPRLPGPGPGLRERSAECAP